MNMRLVYTKRMTMVTMSLLNMHQQNDNGNDEFAGYAPIEISILLYGFLKASGENYIRVEVLGKQKP